LSGVRPGSPRATAHRLFRRGEPHPDPVGPGARDDDPAARHRTGRAARECLIFHGFIRWIHAVRADMALVARPARGADSDAAPDAAYLVSPPGRGAQRNQRLLGCLPATAAAGAVRRLGIL